LTKPDDYEGKEFDTLRGSGLKWRLYPIFGGQEIE